MHDHHWTRRAFLKWLAAAAGVAALSGCEPDAIPVPATTPSPTRWPPGTGRIASPTPWPLHPARFWRPLDDGSVQCQLCFRNCVVREGRLGFCRNRKNVGGEYYTKVYSRAAGIQADPIEKEPAFHMLPGQRILCTATASCNFRCRGCQNWEISQRSVGELISESAAPAQVVDRAVQEGCAAVSFTYNEPTVFYEYMADIAAQAKAQGLRALFLEMMDAIVVDLKGFDETFYERVSQAALAPVLATLQEVRKTDTHLEVVHLLIPTLNDGRGVTRRMCAWLAQHVGPDTPLHFLRFWPAYKLQRLPPTPIETLETAAAIAEEEGMRYVYIGNMPGHKRNSTTCPACRQRVIHRVHFHTLSVDLEAGKCRFCGEEIPGIWE
jgi:pyruvate formate lyase activating enzyme